MLYDYFLNGFLYKEDWNCAEHVVVGANRVYGLGLSDDAIKMSAGFGGGMAVEGICGAVTGAVMVLGVLFVKERAHESDKIKTLVKELIERYVKSLGEIDCAPLKESYRTEEEKCRNIVLTAVKILDDIVIRELPDLRSRV